MPLVYTYTSSFYIRIYMCMCMCKCVRGWIACCSVHSCVCMCLSVCVILLPRTDLKGRFRYRTMKGWCSLPSSLSLSLSIIFFLFHSHTFTFFLLLPFFPPKDAGARAPFILFVGLYKRYHLSFVVTSVPLSHPSFSFSF